jgi:hypothetical protein
MVGDRGLLLLPELDTLRASSSTKGSEGNRSSSERYEVARGSSSLSRSDPQDRDVRRGHDGNAQLASCPRVEKELGLMSIGADMPLYDPYEPYMAFM